MVGLKIALLLVKYVFINVKKGTSELWRWVAAKNTTSEYVPGNVSVPFGLLTRNPT